MAVSPSIRDPQLNYAECVTEGHKPDILATGQSYRVLIILCCSCFFSILSGPLLTCYVMLYRGTRPVNERGTIDILCVFLLVIFLSLFIYICIVLKSEFKNFIPAIYLLIAVIGFVVGGCKHYNCAIEVNEVKVKWYAMLCFATCANLTVYHFCWLLIGIMLNPTWGLAVLLVVCLVIGVSTYTVFTYKSSDSDNSCQTFFSCLAAFLAICFLIVVVILAGQSYHGRQTADEVLKDGVLYIISVSFSWLYWKHCASSQNSSPTSQPQPNPPSGSSGSSGSSGYELVPRQ